MSKPEKKSETTASKGAEKSPNSSRCSLKICLGLFAGIVLVLAVAIGVYSYVPVSHEPRCLDKDGRIPAGDKLNLRAVITGATGATGLPLVAELLKSKAFKKVTVLSRRRISLPEEFGIDQKREEEKGRLDQQIVDLEGIDSTSGVKYFVSADVHFCCLGTTMSKASSMPGNATENFRRIDYDLIIALAKMSREAGVKHMSLVSSLGAHNESLLLYLRTKGQSDNEVISLGFPRTTIWRPGLLSRYTATDFIRTATRVLQGLPTEDLAKALRLEAECEAMADSAGQKPHEILHNSDIYFLLSKQAQTAQ